MGANLGRAIVTNGDFMASVCDSVPAVGAAVSGGACSGPRHCCITWGPRRARGKGRFVVFVPHSHNRKYNWITDCEMFRIRTRKLDNISVWKTYCWKARFMGFSPVYSVSRSRLRFMRN